MAVMAGNKRYETADDLPQSVPVFPLSGALLLPSGQLPLNIFEPRYLAMVDAALAGDRLIGMIQPAFDAPDERDGAGALRDRLPRPHHPILRDRRRPLRDRALRRQPLPRRGGARRATPYRQVRISIDGFSDLERAAQRRGRGRPLGAAPHLSRLSRSERSRRRLGQRQPRLECRARHRAFDDEPVGPAGEAGAARIARPCGAGAHADRHHRDGARRRQCARRRRCNETRGRRWRSVKREAAARSIRNSWKSWSAR